MVLGQRRFDDAPAALSAAEEPEQALADDHPLRLGLRGRALRAQLEIGESAAVHAALVGKLALAGEGSAPAVYPGPAAIEALLLDAAANDQIGDVRAAGYSLERALELAEPDGIVLPFALVPLGGLLERHRGHRTSHAALLTTIICGSSRITSIAARSRA